MSNTDRMNAGMPAGAGSASESSRKKKKGRLGRKARRTISIALAVVMSMSILTLFLGAEAGLGIFKKSNVMAAINESDYQDEAYEEFSECYEDLLSANGFGEYADDLTETAFSESRFRTDLGSSIKAALEGKEKTVKTTKERKALQTALQDNLVERGYRIDKQTRSAMKKIAEQAESYYKNYTRFAFGTYYSGAQANIERNLKIVVPVAAAVLIICIGVIYMINPRKRSFFRYTRCALIGATVPCLYAFYKVGCAADVFSDGGGYYYDMIECLYRSSIAPLVFTEIILVLGWAILYKLGKNAD